MRYEAPESVEGAIALLSAATGEARVLAGGTDLLVQMRADVVDPDLIVDIKKIAETRAVTEEKGGWRIGAAVTGAELKEHAKLKTAWPGVVEAANLIGSTQVQGRATLGGNLCNGSPAADRAPALIAAGAVAARVLLVQEAAQAIVGSRLDLAAQQRLEAAARAACQPIDDKRGTIEFRTDVAAVPARRTALIALDRARTS